MSQSTLVPDEFPGYPAGIRAGQLPDPTLKSYFLTLFGRSERVTACACERSGEVTMPQLLHLQNGETVLRKISDGNGRLQQLRKAGKTDDQVVEELFLATLSKPPTEAARAARDYGSVTLALDEIVAVTVPANRRSRRDMERLGMTRDPADDFDHPNLPAGPLNRHVLYRLENAAPASKA